MTATTFTPSSTMSRKTMMVVWMALFGIVAVSLGTSSAFRPNVVAMTGQTARREKLSTVQSDSGSAIVSRRTALHYSNSNDGSSQSRWWKNLLSAPPATGTTAATASPSQSSSTTGEDTQQETVDAYLEFLDRRYRRLHSDEEEARKRKQAEAAASNGNSKSFSAMEWLMNGSSQHGANAELEQQRQQEDALYVLGVAGLASQKLLQKHHLQTSAATSEATSPALKAGETSSLDKDKNVIEVQAETDDDITINSNRASQFFIKKVLVPIIRAMYIVQRRKNLVVQRIQSRVASVAARAAQRVVHPVARRIRKGPKAVVESLLEIGGGKRNMVVTLACAYATVMLLRPILQAAVTEASVGP